jgi:EAL domain-containing protein (putative c-di-GMP-specific phosphodiesterase class I)
MAPNAYGLTHAIGTNQIKVFMQPQVRLADRKIVSAEALVRWQKPDGTLVMPSDFIELAENSGDIIPLGRQVANLAFSAKSMWETGGCDVKVSINTSPRELATPGTAKVLAQLAEKYGLDPGTITIEITETAFANDGGVINREIELLSHLGFRLAIDDFGMGHSSLMRLTALKVSEVKLDRSLCLKIERDPRSVSIAKFIWGLGIDLNFDVLAEGIETEEQYKVLLDIGIPFGQGYLFGRPQPTAEFLHHVL